MRPVADSEIIGRRGEGAFPVREAAMRSVVREWIDAKPYRFELILLAHTAAMVAALMAAIRF